MFTLLEWYFITGFIGSIGVFAWSYSSKRSNWENLMKSGTNGILLFIVFHLIWFLIWVSQLLTRPVDVW